MSNPYQRLSTWMIRLAGLLVLSLALAACGGGEAAPAAEEPAAPAGPAEVANTPTSVSQPATAEQQSEGATEVAPTEEAAASTATPTGPAQCQTVDVPDFDLLPPVADSDWTRGPAAAPITLVEYGDFQ